MKLISGIVGIVLLIASTVIVILSTSDESYVQKKDAMVMKYVAHSTQALEDGEVKDAIKFAKLAIVVDPKSKKAFKAYEMAVELKYKPNDDEEEEEDNSREAPQDEEEEEAPDMGC